MITDEPASGIADLGGGSFFIWTPAFRAFSCRIDPDQPWLPEPNWGDAYNQPPDEEEGERLLLHDMLVDEYLWRYGQNQLEGITFSQWIADFQPKAPKIPNDESEEEL